MNRYAPIALFVYNRPNHTIRTISALQTNHLAKESDLFIFSDAPKNELANDSVEEVRKFIKSISGFKSITIIERDINYGLVKSISEGVTDIIDRFDKIIVVEDDLITHKQFLEYMNKSLDLYKNKQDVHEITGYSYINTKSISLENQSYFLKISSTWGWATWSDRWIKFSDGLTGIESLHNDSKLKYQFNYNNSYNYYKLVNDNKKGIVKSWGIVWYWNIFKNNGLTLYPTETLIDQIGFDGSGENSKNYLQLPSRIKDQNYEFHFPDIIEESLTYRKKIIKILRFRKLFVIINALKYILKIQ
ncbi:hypothetical protein [Dyadobacter frigoris]|uniref:Glycosyltransferase n=1 Tax=Dyadobacter frigoris TaxID=2576211 RepID=A0A4U6CSP3_9BACT|nr:hypothetical protein [Dyadobacter frigoris]TKT87650.1 hypothetical protein FDK13_29125 [Dyadobacter frigoris]